MPPSIRNVVADMTTASGKAVSARRSTQYDSTSFAPTSASTTARIGRSTRSGIRGALALPAMMPGIEPTRSEASIDQSTAPSNQYPEPAMRVSGTAWAMSLPTIVLPAA